MGEMQKIQIEQTVLGILLKEKQLDLTVMNKVQIFAGRVASAGIIETFSQKDPTREVTLAVANFVGCDVGWSAFEGASGWNDILGLREGDFVVFVYDGEVHTKDEQDRQRKNFQNVMLIKEMCISGQATTPDWMKKNAEQPIYLQKRDQAKQRRIQQEGAQSGAETAPEEGEVIV